MLGKIVATVHAEYIFSKAQRLAQLGRFDEAVELFDEALSLKPNDSSIYLHKALSLAEKNDYGGSIATILRAVVLNPSNSVYRMFLGRIHYDYDQLDEALKAFEESLNMDRSNEVTWCFKYLTLISKGENTVPYEELRNRIQGTSPHFQSRLIVLCEGYLQQNGIRSAFSGKPVLQDQGTTNVVDRLLVRSFGWIEGLVNSIRYASDSPRKSAYMHCLEGDKLSLLGDHVSAIADYIKALDIMPDLDQAKQRLAEAYLNNGEYEHALECVFRTEQYLRDRPILMHEQGALGDTDCIASNKSQDQYLCLVLGIIYYELNQVDQSVVELARAVELGLTDHLAYYYLGLCSIAHDDTFQARRWFQQAARAAGPQLASNRFDEMIRLSRDTAVDVGEFVGV
ncbi:MAG: tetratricopeptide repeat protein [Chloroflexota bacterium]|nr:tetratricopeptide repeat protein [Chloroflexota bacterium]